MSRKKAFAFVLLFFSFSFLISQNASVVNVNLKQGADAYMAGDWTSAIFFLRKVVSTPGNFTDENVFMLIKSEIYAGEYRQAESDCEKFLSQFPASPYSEYVFYQKGRLLHLLAKNEDAVLSLSDFCHENPESELFPLALFWIAESFYDEYNFESARGLYERLVNDYPACEKAPQAQYKLDLIERRSREEKLLYLLKVIGEENLSTREEYERQLRVYSLEDENGVRKALLEAQARIAELEATLEQNEFAPVPLSEEPEKIEVAEEPVKSEAVAEKSEAAASAPPPAVPSSPSSGISKPAAPVTHVIQSVNEPSFRVRQTGNGQGMTAAKSAAEAEKNADVQALRRKAKQLQYLLDEQTEETKK